MLLNVTSYLKGECYALKSLARPNVIKAWKSNTELWKTNPDIFKSNLYTALDIVNPKMFRYFVAGDYPDVAFARFMIDTAVKYPGTQFLSFTKQYPIWNQFKDIPANLNIIYSAWPTMEMVNPFNRPVAYMQDGR